MNLICGVQKLNKYKFLEYGNNYSKEKYKPIKRYTI